MSDEYEGKLIQDLFSATNDQEIIDVLEEIQQNGSAVFKYSILQLYENNRDKSISHYFIITLTKLNISGLTDILLSIGKDPKTKKVDLGYIVQYLNENNYYEEQGKEIAFKLLKIHFKDSNVFHLELMDSIIYLINAGCGDKIEPYLITFFESPIYSNSVRTYTLNSYLKINPNKNTKWLINNYDVIIENKGVEEVIANVIINWKGNQIEILRNRITQGNNIKAKHIISTYDEKIKKELEDKEKIKEDTIQKTYRNAEIISKIVVNRVELNQTFKRIFNTSYVLLPQNESIVKQYLTANDEANFIKTCSDLRSFITQVSDEFKNIDLSLTHKEIKILLPDTDPRDYNKSINQIFLFLKSKDFKLKTDLFGLRILNQIVNLITHPEESDRLLKLLEKEKLYDIYKSGDFAKLHKLLLEKYLEFLSKFISLLNTNND